MSILDAIGYEVVDNVDGRIELDEPTTALWNDLGPNGAEVREDIRRDAALIAKALGESIEIATVDGVVLERVPVVPS